MDVSSAVGLQKGGKLRKGFTTGSCAAAATKAATFMLLFGGETKEVSILTPKGIPLRLSVVDITKEANWVSCAIKKDSGDDPDVTNGILIYAKVEKAEKGILIDGGRGVGRVTKKGLEQPVGAAAINHVPRERIARGAEEVCQELGYTGGLRITISVPRGEELAGKTFNPRLGIQGGISILGTSGIVEPMSEQAIVDSIAVEMKMKVANGAEYLILTPGNYGQRFIKDTMGIDLEKAVKVSNFVGDSLDIALDLQLRGILLVGHIGKFIKLAGGIMQTHSKNADCRLELLGIHAALSGAERETLQDVMESVTTEQALVVLKEKDLLEKTMQSVMDKIEYYIKMRDGGQMETGVILFSDTFGILGVTQQVPVILERIKGKGE